MQHMSLHFAACKKNIPTFSAVHARCPKLAHKFRQHGKVETPRPVYKTLFLIVSEGADPAQEMKVIYDYCHRSRSGLGLWLTYGKAARDSRRKALNRVQDVKRCNWLITLNCALCTVYFLRRTFIGCCSYCGLPFLSLALEQRMETRVRLSVCSPVAMAAGWKKNGLSWSLWRSFGSGGRGDWRPAGGCCRMAPKMQNIVLYSTAEGCLWRTQCCSVCVVYAIPPKDIFN